MSSRQLRNGKLPILAKREDSEQQIKDLKIR